MRKITMIVMVVLMAALLAVAPSFGYPVSVGDLIKIDGAGSGGIGNANRGGAFEINDGLFWTFCLERNEYFTPGYSYYIGSITNGAIKGGLSGGDPDPLSSEAAYLYYMWSTRSIDHTDVNANALQLAIWYFEGELGTLTLTDLANDYIADAEANRDGTLYGVRVMNLYGSYDSNQGFYSDPKQDMLIIPEPSTLLLLGAGLLGMGLAVRRRKR